jgi:hypothetical protein
MLRAAIKHGITKALSTRAGFEVWDFEIREEQPSPDRVTIDIRYRYQPGLCFRAEIAAKGEDGKVPTYEITAEAVPGEVGDRERLLLAGRHEMCTAIERWTSRIEEELSARPSNRVLAAQEKAISYLEKHLLDIPEQRLTRERILEYGRRLDRLEVAVIELRASRDPSGARADAVKQEFACLRTRLEVLGERSFLHAVLVRLVMYFWDDENLRIVEAGSRAAQDFLRHDDRPLAARHDAAALARPSAAPGRVAKAEPAPISRAAPPAPARGDEARPLSVPRPDAATLGRPPAAREGAPRADPPATSRAAPPALARRDQVLPARPDAATPAQAATRPLGVARPEPPAASREVAPTPAPAAQTTLPPPAASPARAPDRQRAAYKPLRPGRG